MTNYINYKTLRSVINKFPKQERTQTRDLLEKLDILKIVPDESLTGTKVRGFHLEDKKYEADSYIDVLRQIIKIVLTKNPNANDKLLSITGKKNKYFSKKPEDLRRPELIKGIDIYMETNENSKTICVRCEKILKYFNLDYTSFEIDCYK